MVIIRFDDTENERRAIGWLAGRFSFKTWANGDLMLHEEAVACLAREGISFGVKGIPTYEQCIPAIRNPAAAPV